MGNLVTSREIEATYKISRTTVDRWRKEGMPYVKVGRGVRFDLEAVNKWIAENKGN